MSIHHTRITGSDYTAMADLVKKHKVTVARHTVEKVRDGYRVDAHASDAQIQALEAAGYKVEHLEDAEAEGKARQQEMRNSAGAALSVATATGYLNIDEVEAALAAEALAPNNGIH